MPGTQQKEHLGGSAPFAVAYYLFNRKEKYEKFSEGKNSYLQDFSCMTTVY
jgi:hypothetical protein